MGRLYAGGNQRHRGKSSITYSVSNLTRELHLLVRNRVPVQTFILDFGIPPLEGDVRHARTVTMCKLPALMNLCLSLSMFVRDLLVLFCLVLNQSLRLFVR